MRLRPATTILTAEITVNDREAELLEFMTSYGIAKEFAEKFSKKYTEEEIKTTLDSLRTQLHRILAAKVAAYKALGEQYLV